MQALAARRESDMLVREGGGGGGDARCNVHFLVHHDRQRRQRRRQWSTVDLDHHRTTMVGYSRAAAIFAKPFSIRLAPDVYRGIFRDLRDC